MIIDHGASSERPSPPSRRRFLGLLATAAAGGLLGAGTSCSAGSAPDGPGVAAPATPPSGRLASGSLASGSPAAAQAWQALAAGNERFVAGRATHPHEAAEWRDSLVEAQHPIACVLACIDSRVPPELVFDQGFGDLLTVRTAGEVLDEAVIGSVEYGLEHLNVPLVVVLGHAGCGAVKATVDAVRGTAAPHGDIAALVHAIEPAVRAVPTDTDEAAYLEACVAEQARQVASDLALRSTLVSEAVRSRGVEVVPAVYDLADGAITRLA